MMCKFKGIDKKDNTEVKEYQDTYDDIDLSGARQVQQNIQDVVDEWWNNNNLTEEQQIRKNELFPNGKPSADEFLIALVEDAKKILSFKRCKRKQKRKSVSVKQSKMRYM